MDYPIWDIAMGGGVLMGWVAITHVIVSHFAIGGGLVIAVTETLAVRRGDPDLRDLAKRSSLVLILFSTVFGAISGVGIWLVAGLISPAAISALIRNYVWGWAIEWVFFVVEIVAALVYYATWERLSKRTHVWVGWIYFVSAYLSLVIINGIITFMLTPGRWLASGSFWDGFFNPTYFPSLVLRTGIAMLMAVAFMLWPVRRGPREVQPRLYRYLGLWAVAAVGISYAGYRWWEATLPEATRALFLGDAPTLAALGDTRHFLMWSLTAVLVLSLVFLMAMPRQARAIPVLLIGLTAFAFFGGYERLREGTRKPFLIHQFMFSNGIRVDEIESLNETGLLDRARWASVEITGEKAEPGRQIFRLQCASCHTLDGYLGIRDYLPEDPDMIYGVLFALADQGQAFVDREEGEIVDLSELDYPFMPPFVGTEMEMEALVEYLSELATEASVVAEKGEKR